MIGLRISRGRHRPQRRRRPTAAAAAAAVHSGVIDAATAVQPVVHCTSIDSTAA